MQSLTGVSLYDGITTSTSGTAAFDLFYVTKISFLVFFIQTLHVMLIVKVFSVHFVNIESVHTKPSFSNCLPLSRIH